MQRVQQSPTDPDFVQNPYPFYNTLRGLGPLVWWDEMGMPVAHSHTLVDALLRDRRFGRENPFPPMHPDHQVPFWSNEAHSLLSLEPPRHTRLRAQVLRAFTSRRIAGLTPEIDRLAKDLAAALPDTPFDLIEQFAAPLPVRVIARLLGVPEDDAPHLLSWSNAMVKMYQAGRSHGDEIAASKATIEFSAYLGRVIAERTKAPGDDLLSHLIAVENDGKLSRDETISTSILLLNAGHEATVHTLGNGVVALKTAGLWGHPVTPALIEEVLRFDPPLHLFTRYAMDEIEIAGHRFARGEEVGLLLASANRDPEAYQDPDRFQADRYPNAQPSTSFGAGLHFCLGAPLARMELEAGLRVLMAQPLEIVTPPRFANIYHFHGLDRLRVQRRG